MLELFKPQPSVREVLDGRNPKRAIEYWDDAIQELVERKVIGHYGGYDDAARDLSVPG